MTLNLRGLGDVLLEANRLLTESGSWGKSAWILKVTSNHKMLFGEKYCS